MLRRQYINLHSFINVLRFNNKHCNLYRINKKLFCAQTKLQKKDCNENKNESEISVNFSSFNPLTRNYCDDDSDCDDLDEYLLNNEELKVYLFRNNLEFDEISDIILKYGFNEFKKNDIDILYKEIENYLQIKREIDTFPVELHEKILQYARDTSYIGVNVEKIRKQIQNELISIQKARIDIDKTVETMNKMDKMDKKKMNGSGSILELILKEFINSIDNDLQKQSDLIIKSKNNRLSSKILAIIDSKRSAEIGIRTLIDHIHSIHNNDNNNNDNEHNGIPYNIICNAIGKEIERDLFLQNKLSSISIRNFLGNKEKENDRKSRLNLASNLGIKIGDTLNQRNIYEIGGLILDSIINSCLIGRNAENAFIHRIHHNGNKKQIGIISCNKEFDDILSKEIRYKPPTEIAPIAQPMIIPPRPWKNIDEGPFFYYNESFMRYIDYKNQYKPLKNIKNTGNNINDLLQCINILQSTAWKINYKVLNVINHIYYNEDGNIAGLPNKNDIPLPNVSDFNNDYKNKEYEYKLLSIKKLNAEQHSLRCDLKLRLDLAKQLETENEIYFPLNIDFRGRIYPISPHVNHIGSDVVRGLMLFSKSKILGKRGWFWLNVNLANKFGFDKVSNIERFEWSLKHRDKIISVWCNPLENRWWLTADAPFQALSICIEIGEAYNNNNGNVYKYNCSLPVGQDGSCNGLQHYAAMLLDEKMAKHVNVANNSLYNLDRGDVYSAVQKCVSNMVCNDLLSSNTNSRNNKLAKLMNNKITRKIVKQTVMTSVYGVTSYGAKNQIMKWLSAAIECGDICFDDNNNNNNNIDIQSKEGELLLLELSVYLSKYTMIGIGLTNTPAYLSMLWLKNCAMLIAKNGYRVSWITPLLNLPCTQHYCDKKKNIKTNKQNIQYITHSSDNKKDINILKQSSAFPPNFIHSLDSTHCLLTARECYLKYGLVFASIHDSFWTHSCDVDIMSKVLRKQFIKLHGGKTSLLYQLYQSFSILYPDIPFSPPPNQSNFDIKQVNQSEFFFS